MKWRRNKKIEQNKPEEPVDILEIFAFIQKTLTELSAIKEDIKSGCMDIFQLRKENELLKMQISLLEKMMGTEV